MTQPQASTGPAMSPEEEADHRRRVAEQLADEAEAAIERREQTIHDLQESLKAAKAEAKQLRADAKKGGAE